MIAWRNVGCFPRIWFRVFPCYKFPVNSHHSISDSDSTSKESQGPYLYGGGGGHYTHSTSLEAGEGESALLLPLTSIDQRKEYERAQRA